MVNIKVLSFYMLSLVIFTMGLDRIIGTQIFISTISILLIIFMLLIAVKRDTIFKSVFIYYILFINIVLLVIFSNYFVVSFSDSLIRFYSFLFWFSIFFISSQLNISYQNKILKLYIFVGFIYILYSYIVYFNFHLVSLNNLGIYRFQTPIGSANTYPMVALYGLISIYIIKNKFYYILVPFFLHTMLVSNSRTMFLTMFLTIFMIYLFKNKYYLFNNARKLTIYFILLSLLFLIIPMFFDWYIDNSELFANLEAYRLNVETLKYRLLGTFIFWTESSLDNYGLPFGLRSVVYANLDGWAIPPDNTFMQVLYEGGIINFILFCLFLVYALKNKTYKAKPEILIFIFLTIFFTFNFLDFIKIRYETSFFWILLGFLNHKEEIPTANSIKKAINV